MKPTRQVFIEKFNSSEPSTSSICSKLILLTVFAVCLIATTRANPLEDTIYNAIQGVLSKSYPTDPKKVQCIMDDFRANKLSKKFMTVDLLTQNNNLVAEIKPHVDAANDSMYTRSLKLDIVLVTFFPLQNALQNCSSKVFKLITAAATLTERASSWNFFSCLDEIECPIKEE